MYMLMKRSIISNLKIQDVDIVESGNSNQNIIPNIDTIYPTYRRVRTYVRKKKEMFQIQGYYQGKIRGPLL